MEDKSNHLENCPWISRATFQVIIDIYSIAYVLKISQA